jgi:hypothetical protein
VNTIQSFFGKSRKCTIVKQEAFVVVRSKVNASSEALATGNGVYFEGAAKY